MRRLDPRIHVSSSLKGANGRDKPGHDEKRSRSHISQLNNLLGSAEGKRESRLQEAIACPGVSAFRRDDELGVPYIRGLL
jgi:hypothetical protein